MRQKINITIPEPCHENWQAMTVGEKGRFCSSCQKEVFDFTNSSDRKIIEAYQKNNHLCGRFLKTQLNRDLVKPKEKSSLWLTTTSTILSFLAFGTNEAIAQGEPKMVQTDKKGISENSSIEASTQEKEISGVVSDLAGALPGVIVIIKDTKIGTQSDFDGKFTIQAKEGNILVFSFLGMIDEEITIGSGNLYNVYLKEDPKLREMIFMVGGISTNRQNFFERTFQKIGNLFKSKNRD